MEDFSRRHRLARRLAIVAMICSSTAQVIADQPTKSSGPASGDSLRSLLAQGFDGTPKTVAKSEALPASVIPQKPLVAAPQPKPAPKQIALPPFIAQAPNKAAIVKKATPVVNLESVTKSAPAPSSLAELLRPRPVPIVVPQSRVELAQPTILPVDALAASAPIVKRLAVAKRLKTIAPESGEVDTMKSNERAAPLPAFVDANVKNQIEDPISFVPPMEFPLPTMGELLEIETETTSRRN